jgi:hypothetical protein
MAINRPCSNTSCLAPGATAPPLGVGRDCSHHHLRKGAPLMDNEKCIGYLALEMANTMWPSGRYRAALPQPGALAFRFGFSPHSLGSRTATKQRRRRTAWNDLSKIPTRYGKNVRVLYSRISMSSLSIERRFNHRRAASQTTPPLR